MTPPFSCARASPLTAAYGDPAWESWVLDEKTSVEHIKHAYERGINAFE